MKKVKDYFWYGKFIIVGLSIIPYQIATGMSIRLFEGLGIRIYLGPFKLIIQVHGNHKQNGK